MNSNHVKNLTAEILEGHSLGDKNCKYCVEGFPRPCQCGGLFHANIQKAKDNGYILFDKCDKCGAHT